MNTAPRTLLSIQYLRGLAALAVVAFHTGRTHTVLGAAGVDVFFVISGFIMMLVSRKEATPAAFLRARVIRVVPLYWLMTLLLAALHPVDAWHLAQSLAFWPHPGPDGHGWPVLVPGWTLCFEAFFYVLFAASLLMPRRRMEALTVVLLGLVATGRIMHFAPWTALDTYTNPVLLEFVTGMWLHHAWTRGWLRHAWPALPLGVAAFAVQAALPDPGAWRVLAWGGPAALIVSGALSCEGMERLPKMHALHQTGDASYATYLVQSLVLGVALPVLQPLPVALAVPGAMLACVAAGCVVFRWIERPCGRWLARRSAPSQLQPRHNPA